MKNTILSKNKGCLFFLLPKIYQLPVILRDVCPKNIFLPNLGGRGNCPSYPPRLLRLWTGCSTSGNIDEVSAAGSVDFDVSLTEVVLVATQRQNSLLTTLKPHQSLAVTSTLLAQAQSHPAPEPHSHQQQHSHIFGLFAVIGSS